MKTSPVFKIISIVVLAAVLVYFGIQINNSISNPLVTTYAYTSETERVIEVDGWLIRDEEAISYNSGVLSPSRKEGEKVGKGGVVAVAYKSENSLATVEEINELNQKLEQLEYAQTTFLDSDQTLKLDSSINDDIIALKQKTAGGDYQDTYDSAANLKSSIVKRDYTTYTSNDEILSDIADTESKIASLQSSLSGATSIKVEKSGIYSSLSDGYEGVLTMEFLDGITPEKMKSISADNDAKGNVGKMIYGNTWYYAVVMDVDDTSSLYEGLRVKLRFTKGITQDFTVRVSTMSEAVNGEVVVVFSSSKYISELTQLRHQSAQIILGTYEGIHIPSTALRMRDGVTGVYCIVGANARFKPISVIYQGDGYVLAEAGETYSSIHILRSGDEVIITSGEIEDGDVIRLN